MVFPVVKLLEEQHNVQYYIVWCLGTGRESDFDGQETDTTVADTWTWRQLERGNHKRPFLTVAGEDDQLPYGIDALSDCNCFLWTIYHDAVAR